MKYLTQTTDITSEKTKDLDYGRVVLDTTTGSVYLLGYSIKYQTVDLGLTSGTLWMDRNIGAEEITDNGLYFAWGETQGYTAEEIGLIKQFDWTDYKYYNYSAKQSGLTKYCDQARYGYNSFFDDITTLETTDDAVFQNTHKFYLPTKEQFAELLMETDVYLIKADGIEIHGTYDDDEQYVPWDTKPQQTDKLNGVEFRKKSDNNVKLFLPSAGWAYDGKLYGVGYYGSVWSNENGGNISVWELGFGYYSAYFSDYSYRCDGFPVRGVTAASNNFSDAVRNFFYQEPML